MTRTRQHLRGTLASVSLAAWLLAATGLAGLAGPGPAAAYEALNTAVHELARDLARDLASKHALKRSRPVLVTPDDFFEQGEGLRLPLSETLSEAFRDELSGYGVTTVLIPGDNAEILDIKGKWIGSCEHGLLLSVAINQRTDSGGVKRVATARERVRQVNPELCMRDIDFLGRDVVRQLERGLRDKRTVYVRPVAVAGEAPQPERLGAYLASWLNAALAQGRTHRRLTALHPAGELDPLSAKEIATRPLAPRRSGPGNAPSSLAGDMGSGEERDSRQRRRVSRVCPRGAESRRQPFSGVDQHTGRAGQVHVSSRYVEVRVTLLRTDPAGEPRRWPGAGDHPRREPGHVS